MDKDVSKMFELVKQGNLEGLKDMVDDTEVKKRKRNSLLNSVDEDGYSVLHWAAQNGHTLSIRWLLTSSEGGGRAAGFSNVLAKTNKGRTALHLAALNGHLECCQALVEGSMIDNGERAELLNAVDEEGWTVLHWAAQNGHPSVIRWLLSSSEGGGRAAGFSKVLAKADDGATAMHLAGYLECCQALVEGCNIENGERAELMNAVDNQGWTVLHIAAVNGHTSVIQWLLSSEEEGGRAAGFTSSSITAKSLDDISVLHSVAESGSVEALNALLSGCTVGKRLTLFLSVDKHGWTPLHAAARWRQPDIIRELLLNHPETQTIVDARDHRGMTALHRAVIGGINEESKKEWREGWYHDIFGNVDTFGNVAVIAALLTTQSKNDEDKNQQAAMVDPNSGTKIE